jgi:hypothetical protein
MVHFTSYAIYHSHHVVFFPFDMILIQKKSFFEMFERKLFALLIDLEKIRLFCHFSTHIPISQIK